MLHGDLRVSLVDGGETPLHSELQFGVCDRWRQEPIGLGSSEDTKLRRHPIQRRSEAAAMRSLTFAQETHLGRDISRDLLAKGIYGW